MILRLDEGLNANIGEVGVEQDVHDTPSLIGGVALQLNTEITAHATASTITTDRKTSFDSFANTLTRLIHTLKHRGNWVCIEILSQGLIDIERDQLAAVVRL